MDHAMKFPIIEARKYKLFVLDRFEGEIGPTEVVRPFNYSRNLTKYVIDSEGKVWVFNHTGHDRKGVLRRVLSLVVSRSHDFYSYKAEHDKTVDWFRGVMDEYKIVDPDVDDPDSADLAENLLDSVSTCPGDMRLRDAMGLMNL
jgi:hypothetical protein